MRRPIFDSLVETASDHHGYVTMLQARAAGADPTQLRLLAGSGRLEHVARGVYRVPVLHDLSNVNPSVVHLTAPPDNYPRAQGSGPVRIHRRHLPVNDVTVVDGLPVTTVARTIVDCQELGTDPAQLRLAISNARQSGELSASQAAKIKMLMDHRGIPT